MDMKFTMAEIKKAISEVEENNKKNWYKFKGDSEERRMQRLSESIGMRKLLMRLIENK